MPLKTHTIKNPQGKVYSYRGKKITFWFTEDEIRLLEIAYNYEKVHKLHNFTDKERSNISKFLKALVLKYAKMIKEKYSD